MKEKKVISCVFGGLGDWLLLSTLPRRFAEQGYEVFIHEGPLSQWRSAEIKELMMANPYLSKVNGGFSTLPPNAGHGIYIDLWGRFCEESRLRPPDPVALMEEVNGLPPPYSHGPEIYLDVPAAVQMRDDIIVIDPYSSSVPFTQDSVGPWVDFYKPQMCERGIPRTFHVLETPGHAAFHRALFGFPKIEVKSIRESIGLMLAVHAFFGVESGGQMLAAAVKKRRPELRVHALFSTRGNNQKFYRLPEVVDGVPFVQYDATCFALQNDFAIDPGMLGYRHAVETAQMAERTRAAEAAPKPEPPVTAMSILRGAVTNGRQYPVGIPDSVDPQFPRQDAFQGEYLPAQTEASM